MKMTFNRAAATIVAAINLAGGGVSAQDEEIPDFSFVRFVNVVAAGEGNTHYELDGRDLFPKGYKFGQRTGGVPVPPGSANLEVKKTGVEPGTTKLALVKDETTTLIVFSEKVETEEDEPPEWKARILKLKQQDTERGFKMTVISVSAQPEVAFTMINGAQADVEATFVKRFQTTSIELGDSRGDVELLQRDGKSRLCLFAPDAPGNYVVVIYDNPEGGLGAMSFYDPKFVIAG